jgi:hypothetical protein
VVGFFLCSSTECLHFLYRPKWYPSSYGVSSLAAIIRSGQTWDKFHTDLIRIPMIVFAVCGSLLNLAALKRIRNLRARPAAKWRLKPLTTRTIQMERAQFVLSIATLILFAIEEATHWKTFHRF